MEELTEGGGGTDLSPSPFACHENPLLVLKHRFLERWHHSATENCEEEILGEIAPTSYFHWWVVEEGGGAGLTMYSPQWSSLYYLAFFHEVLLTLIMDFEDQHKAAVEREDRKRSNLLTPPTSFSATSSSLISKLFRNQLQLCGFNSQITFPVKAIMLSMFSQTSSCWSIMVTDVPIVLHTAWLQR